MLDGRVVVLTLNRPQRKNALGPEEWQALSSHIVEARSLRKKDVRVLLLRGAGGAFSSGGDLRTMPDRLSWPLSTREAQLRGDGHVISLLYDLDVPVIAQIEGPCLGAGLALALASDIRIASESATFGAVFHRVGLSLDFGLSFLLPHTVGSALASDMLWSAEIMSAARARDIGLVQRVVPQDRIGEEVWTLCQKLADGPPLAHAATKRALHRTTSPALRAAIEWEAQAQTLVGKSADTAEGVAAFLSKRPPKFRGA
jgi:2-(1,2-epoxy-1,2-dihydrophenyl)acetyl-CoA isomerase